MEKWIFTPDAILVFNGQAEYWWVPEINAYVGYGPGGDMVRIRFNSGG